VGLVVALAAGVILAGCDATPLPPPTSAPPRTSPSPTRLTAVQKRCVAEARSLIGASRALQSIQSIASASPGRPGQEAALSAAQDQLAQLSSRAVHKPFVADRAALVQAANDMIEGYQNLLGPGNHSADRGFIAQVTKGSSAAAGVEANVGLHRTQCLS
jgi:hypothetical protein